MSEQLSKEERVSSYLDSLGQDSSTLYGYFFSGKSVSGKFAAVGALGGALAIDAAIASMQYSGTLNPDFRFYAAFGLLGALKFGTAGVLSGLIADGIKYLVGKNFEGVEVGSLEGRV